MQCRYTEKQQIDRHQMCTSTERRRHYARRNNGVVSPWRRLRLPGGSFRLSECCSSSLSRCKLDRSRGGTPQCGRGLFGRRLPARDECKPRHSGQLLTPSPAVSRDDGGVQRRDGVRGGPDAKRLRCVAPLSPRRLPFAMVAAFEERW